MTVTYRSVTLAALICAALCGQQAHSAMNSTAYPEFMAAVVRDTVGEVMGRAMYDPQALDAMAADYPDSHYSDVKGPFVNAFYGPSVWPPSVMSSASGVLVFGKRWVSVGLGRMMRDAEMARMHARAVAIGAEHIFARTVGRVVEGYANYFTTLMQFAVDILPDGQRQALKIFASTHAGQMDAMMLMMVLVKHDTQAAVVDKHLADIGGAVRLAEEELSRANIRAEDREGRTTALFPMDYGAAGFQHQVPPNGKFWYMMRPTASCSSMIRQCEYPDGCRFLCNAEYLLRAGLEGAGGKTGLHRMVGFGSNNEFAWELSMMRMFNSGARSAASKKKSFHHIGSLTIFDCTIGPGTSRGWAIPEELRSSAMGFGYASLCVDRTKSGSTISMSELKGTLLGSENGARGAPEVTRTSVARVETVYSRGESGFRIFDDISVLKVDVEGYEHPAIPSWAITELRSLSRFRNGAMIDFFAEERSFLTVSMLYMEFHRLGPAELNTALRSHYVLLHIYGLGYLVTANEPNPFGPCCYEYVYVHYRHFVRSEMWMRVGDAFL